jgi:hypothetical protein
MADMTKTTMATYLPEVWSRLATITYRATAILAPLMDRRWEPEISVGRGDTVQIPNFSQNTTATKRSTFGTGASLTFDAVTESQTSLLVDTMAYKAFRVPAEMSVQVMATYVPLLINGIGQAVALQIDSDIAGDNSNGFDAFTALGTDNFDVTEDTVLDAETVLNNTNDPLPGRYFVYSPATRQSLLKIEGFRNSLYSGALGQINLNAGPGFQGRILTLDCYMTNNLEAGTAGKKNFIGHMEAIALAVQKNLTMIKDLNVEDGIFDQYVGYAVYGLKLVKSGSGREIDGK